MYALDTTNDNNAWYRHVAASWARRMITGETPGEWAEHTDLEVQFAFKHLHLHPGDQVLDLGCGWGRHSLTLASYGLRVTGLDLSRDLLTLARYTARRQNVQVNWVEGDLANLPLRPGSFDAVAQFCGNMLTWFASPNHAIQVLWDVANLLRPGGRMLFGTDDWQHDLPMRSQSYDEWRGGAAIYRQRYDAQRRIAETQTVVFGPEHERQEYHRQVWWPAPSDMEALFEQAGLVVCGRYNRFMDAPYKSQEDGLVYVLARL